MNPLVMALRFGLYPWRVSCPFPFSTEREADRRFSQVSYGPTPTTYQVPREIPREGRVLLPERRRSRDERRGARWTGIGVSPRRPVRSSRAMARAQHRPVELPRRVPCRDRFPIYSFVGDEGAAIRLASGTIATVHVIEIVLARRDRLNWPGRSWLLFDRSSLTEHSPRSMP